MNLFWSRAVLMVAVSVACNRAELRRTNLDQWETKTFRETGVELELPKQAEIAHDSKFGLVVRMHSIPPGVGVLADTQYLISTEITRVTEAEFVDRLKSLEEARERTPENSWQFWVTKRHETIDEDDSHEYSHYRYDVPCRTGEILDIQVEAHHAIIDGVRKYKDADDQAIRRMLRSVKCLDRKK